MQDTLLIKSKALHEATKQTVLAASVLGGGFIYIIAY